MNPPTKNDIVARNSLIRYLLDLDKQKRSVSAVEQRHWQPRVAPSDNGEAVFAATHTRNSKSNSSQTSIPPSPFPLSRLHNPNSVPNRIPLPTLPQKQKAPPLRSVRQQARPRLGQQTNTSRSRSSFVFGR